MGYRLVPLLLFAVVLGVVLGACGKEIGDACTIASDCSPSGDRICLDPEDQTHPEIPNLWKGYCTIQGCDYSTCPDEAVCVRFFTGSFSNKTCDPMKASDACTSAPADCCSLDELCAVDGHCVARSSEIRYCMRTCDSDGDCRDGYECRDIQKMIDHGGEPVLAPGLVVDARAPKFCAAAPAAP